MLPTRVMVLRHPERGNPMRVAVRWPRYRRRLVYATIGEGFRSGNPLTFLRAGDQELPRIRRAPHLTHEDLVTTMNLHREHVGVREAARTHPGAVEETSAAAALITAARGVVTDPDLDPQLLAAARAVLRALHRPLPGDALETGELLELAPEVLRLLDPDVRETFDVLAPDWVGSLEEAISAAQAL